VAGLQLKLCREWEKRDFSKPMSASPTRREFLKRSLAGLVVCGVASPMVSGVCAAQEERPLSGDLIDTHTHFYDPKRPQGVPWPSPDEKVLYRTVLPKDYKALPQPRTVTGTVVVEASPWVEDNQWILDLAAKDPFIVGLVGHLTPGASEFSKHLARFRAVPLFRGIRLRPSPSPQEQAKADFTAGLKLLADHDLSVDLVGGVEVLEMAARVAKAIPSLRLVIDHLAGVRIDGKEPDRGWLEGLRALAKHEQVFLKISGLVEGTGRSGGKAPRNVEFYKPTLDAACGRFGEDRLIYGSNWPVCELFADLATVQRLTLDYFTPKGSKVLEKVFATNARRAYKWAARQPPQRP
jgi:L-fuconolactonase